MSLYCPRHGEKLTNVKEKGGIRSIGVYYIEAKCKNGGEDSHKVYIEDRSSYEQEGETEIVLS